MPKKLHTLVLNLNAFSQTGGIEKVSRVLAKACYDNSIDQAHTFLNLSLHDQRTDTYYCPAAYYKGYNGSRFHFVWQALKKGSRAEHIILTHINLAIPALLIKLISPKTKIHLLAHGIEVWRNLSPWKRKLLKQCNSILAVSAYTQQRLNDSYPALKNKTHVVNNVLDPLFKLPEKFERPDKLAKRYGIKANERVIITLCRLSSSERYKGYDQVIIALSQLPSTPVKYLLLGKYDEVEFLRIQKLVQKHQLQDKVIITGYIDDKEINEHFLLADLLVMPSKKEGFGLVYIEAAACGLPVIAGNEDGSTDALLGGELGTLVKPDSVEEIALAIQDTLAKPKRPQQQQNLVLQHFNYKKYHQEIYKHVS